MRSGRNDVWPCQAEAVGVSVFVMALFLYTVTVQGLDTGCSIRWGSRVKGTGNKATPEERWTGTASKKETFVVLRC